MLILVKAMPEASPSAGEWSPGQHGFLEIAELAHDVAVVESIPDMEAETLKPGQLCSSYT